MISAEVAEQRAVEAAHSERRRFVTAPLPQGPLFVAQRSAADLAALSEGAAPVGRVVGPLRLDWFKVGLWFPFTRAAVERCESWCREVEEIRTAARGVTKAIPGGAVSVRQRDVADDFTAWMFEGADRQQAKLNTGGGYPYSLGIRCGDFSVRLAFRSEFDVESNTPNVMLEVHGSELVNDLGDVLNRGLRLVRWLVGAEKWEAPRRSAVSRLDLKVDLQTDGVRSRWLTRGQCVCRSTFKRDNFPTAEPEDARRTFYGRRFTGLEVGGRGRECIRCRVYDKWADLVRKTDAAYVVDEWRANGWDGKRGIERDGLLCGSVWRLEFELGRRPLVELGCATLGDLFGIHTNAILNDWSTGSELPKLKQLWAYLTRSFLRIVVDDPRAPDLDDDLQLDGRRRVTGAVRPEERATEPVWRLWSESAGEVTAAVRNKPSKLKRVTDALLAQASGCMASHLAGNLASENAGEAIVNVLVSLPEKVAAKQHTAPVGSATEDLTRDLAAVVRSAMLSAAARLADETDADGVGFTQRLERMPLLRGTAGRLVSAAVAASKTDNMRRRDLQDGAASSASARLPEKAAPDGEAAADVVGDSGGVASEFIAWSETGLALQEVDAVLSSLRSRRGYLEECAADDAGVCRGQAVPWQRMQWLALKRSEELAESLAVELENVLRAQGWAPGLPLSSMAPF